MTASYLPRCIPSIADIVYARRTKCGVASPTNHHPLGLHCTPQYPSVSWAKAMSIGARSLSMDDLTTFTARLDGLHADQNPDDLSNTLRAAIEKHELYGAYISSLEGDTRRAEALLEVFDRVCSAADSSHGLSLNTDLLHRPFRLPHTMSRSSTSLDNCVAGRDFYQPPTSFPRASSGRPSIQLLLAVLAMFGKASITTNMWR